MQMIVIAIATNRMLSIIKSLTTRCREFMMFCIFHQTTVDSMVKKSHLEQIYKKNSSYTAVALRSRYRQSLCLHLFPIPENGERRYPYCARSC